MLFFHFAEHHENSTYCLGYKLTIQRNSDSNVLSHRAGTEAANFPLARLVIQEDTSWYVPQKTLKSSQQKSKLEHFVYRSATQLKYIKISLSTKNMTTGKIWTFELSVQSGINVPFLRKSEILTKKSIKLQK